MILRYNLAYLLEIYSKDKLDILYHLERRLIGRRMSNRDAKAVVVPLPSFLLEDEAYICYNNKLNENFRKNATLDERIVYLYLAGKRDYLEYKTRGIKTLPTDLSDLPIEKLKLNRLLDIRNDTIYFKSVPTEVGE